MVEKNIDENDYPKTISSIQNMNIDNKLGEIIQVSMNFWKKDFPQEHF